MHSIRNKMKSTVHYPILHELCRLKNRCHISLPLVRYKGQAEATAYHRKAPHWKSEELFSLILNEYPAF